MPERNNSRSTASLLHLALLVSLALLGNSLRVNLFLGADFTFGSIAILLVIYYFGPLQGCLCAALAGAAAYWLWGHPCSLALAILEAAFVGFLLKPGRKDVLLFDGIFWLTLGMPLVWLFHYVIMNAETLESLFIVLTQCVNGVFNALAAGVLIGVLPFHTRRVSPSHVQGKRLHEMLFNLMAAAVLLPVLIATVLNSRHEEQHAVKDALSRLQQASKEFAVYLSTWHDHHLRAIQGIAKGAALSGMVTSEEMEQYIELIISAYPDIQNVNFADTSGVVFGIFPPVSERGEPSIGPIFPELIQREKLPGTKRPATFETFIGKGEKSIPLVVISVPVLEEEQLLGYALGAVNLGQVQQFLLPRENGELEITLVNTQNQVIVSSNRERKARTLFNPRETAETRPISDTINRWVPREWKASSAGGCRNLSFFQDSPVPPVTAWRVVAEIHCAPLLRHLFIKYIQSLAFIVLLCPLALTLAYSLSRRVVQPIETLAEMTTNLPAKLLDQETAGWPKSGYTEIQSLVANIQIMAVTLGHRFRELQEGSAELEKINKRFETQIRESKRTEEALRESEGLYREMSDLLPQPVFEMDLDGRFTFVNRVASKALGYSKEEAVAGLNGTRVFLTENAEKECSDILQYMSGAGSGRNDYEVVRKDGSTFPATVYASPVLRGGRIVGLRGIVVDLTEQKKAETELITRQKLESLGVLAGGLAHDYNNILTGILGNISLAKRFALPGDRVMKRLEQMELAAMKAKDLTQQLLTFARGGAPIKRTTSIARLLERSVNFALLGSNVRCELEIDSDLWASAVDEGQITQVIHNIVLNAVQAMPESGVVTVKASNEMLAPTDGIPVEPGDFVKISISDVGYGIPKEHLSRIFDPYFTTKQKGSGLGLATAYSIIQKHGGFITADSELGSHTTFVIHIPATDEEPPPDFDFVLPMPSVRHRVLLMDDEEVVREVVGEMLEQLGYAVTLAKDGSEAVQLYAEAMRKQTPFDAVIMDLTIPGGMGGREAILRLLEIDPGVRAIVSSGYSGDVVMSHHERFGFKGVVPKPFKMAELARMLEKVIGEDSGSDDDLDPRQGFLA